MKFGFGKLLGFIGKLMKDLNPLEFVWAELRLWLQENTAEREIPRIAAIASDGVSADLRGRIEHDLFAPLIDKLRAQRDAIGVIMSERAKGIRDFGERTRRLDAVRRKIREASDVANAN